MRNKKIIVFLLATLLLSISYPAFAENGVYGGWDEETGYFTNIKEYQDAFIGSENSNEIEPQSTANHRGQKDRTTINGTTHFRAHGWTTWVGVRHYTRARMEYKPLFSDPQILTDSGRVWGNNGTEAISPWWGFVPHINDKARTYYGR